MVDEVVRVWEAFPGAGVLLVAAGLVLAGLGVRANRRDQWRGGPVGAFAYLFLFRKVIVGLALVVAGVGWVLQVPWLFAAGLTISIGELLETSYYINVLRWGQREMLVR